MNDVKHLRDSRTAQSGKLRKLGAQGSLKAARMGEHAPRQYNDARARYADGGIVGDIGGMPSKPRLDRPGRMGKPKGKGKPKEAKTNINIIVAGKGDAPKPDMPMPPPGAMAGPGGPPPMPPPGPPPGGPPMPMRASGGRVKRADGGWTGEGDSGKKLREKAQDVRDEHNLVKGAAGLAGGAGAGHAMDRAALDFQTRTHKILRGVPRVGAALGVLGPPVAGAAYAAKKGIDALTSEGRAKKLEKDADEAEGRKSGGKVMTKAEDERQDRKMAGAAMHKHESALHKGAKFTKFRKGGIAGGCK